MKRIGSLVVLFLMAGKLSASVYGFPVLPDSARTERQPERDSVVPLLEYTGRDTLLPLTYPVMDVGKGMFPLVYLPDSLIRDSLKYEYTRIKDFAFRSKLTKELYKMVFVNPRRGYLNVMRTQNSETRYVDYAGKTIGNVYVKVLPPYGTSVYDTTYYEEDLGWLKTFANKTHMSTAESVIRRQLTLKPGSRLVPFEVVQNEILLRELDYIDDATIILSDAKDQPGIVDVLVICKDQLSWGATVETNLLNNFILGLENKNFLKLGHVLNYEFSYRGTKDKKWGNRLEYKVNSLWGSHIGIRGFYQNDYLEKKVLVDVERPFLTARMRWAGGVAAGRVFYSDDLPDRNVTRLEDLFDYHYQDVWAGKSFQLPYRHSYTRNFYVTGRFFTTLFNRRPQVSDDSNHFYYNRLDYFAAFTYTKIKYYKANLIYDFGRTEDIPTGLYLSVTGGFENSEFENFGYIGTECRYSHFNKYSERFYAVEGALGSYVGSGGFTRGVFKIGGSHISNLCSLGDIWKFRFYNRINYIRGIRRYPEDYLYVEDADIRGFSSDSLRGIQKFSTSIAATLFLPYIKKGFRASVSSFVDLGVVAPEHKSIGKSKAYWGIGLALNLRNDNVVIKNLTFRLTFYPTIPVDGRSVQAVISGRSRKGFYDYRVTKPQVIQYE